MYLIILNRTIKSTALYLTTSSNSINVWIIYFSIDHW